MEFDALKSRAMTEVVRRFPRPEHIGASFFPEKPISGEIAGWDVVEGARNMARYVNKGGEAHISALLPRKRYSSPTALIKEKKTIDEETKNFIDRPGAYDEPYGEQAVADELEALDRMVENRREASRWYALSYGQLDVSQTDPAVRFVVDYGMDSDHKVVLTGTDKWSDTTNSKPLDDLLEWKTLIAKDSGVTATEMYCNSEVMRLLVANSDIRDLLKYTVGDMLAKNGYITALAGLNITVNDTTYVDDSGVVQYFIPSDRVLIVAKNGLGKTFVSPSDVPTGDTTRKVVGKFSYSWVTKDPVDTWMLVGVRELPVIQNPDQLVIAQIK